MHVGGAIEMVHPTSKTCLSFDFARTFPTSIFESRVTAGDNRQQNVVMDIVE